MWQTAVVVLPLLAGALGAVCQSPRVTPKTFSTTDAFFHQQTTFIAAFTLECTNGKQEVPLFAHVNGRLMPVSIGEETGVYQVTWTEEHKNAPSGTYTVALYDEDGYAALRKAQRNNENTEKVPKFATIDLHHPGAARTSYVSTETIAFLIAIGLFYVAFNYRSQLTA